MADENRQQHPQQPELEYVLPDPESGIVTTYANNVQLGLTAYDLRILFGELVDANSKKIIIEQRVHVTLSYLQAKLLMLMLAQALQQHESAMGEVKIPPELLSMNSVTATAPIPPGVSARTK